MEKELFHVSIKERYRLNHPSSQKKTYHIVLDLKGLNADYQVGDCVAIYPTNPPEQVEKLVALTGGNSSDFEALSKKFNISRINRSLFDFAKIEMSPEEKKKYVEEHEVLDFLEENPLTITSEQLFSHLSPLLPRFYSIASSKGHVGEEAHLTVVLTEYETSERRRMGTCSYYLTQMVPLNNPVIPIYIQKNREFTITNEMQTKPIIMIGPGTGIAPFLGFMQERNISSHTGKNWLFFGERNRKSDFYYENFWQSQIEQKKLKLDVAFSRDQEEKIYVQHKMLEQGKEFFSWIEEGAHIFVSGDAKNMAKDVEKALHQIIIQHGNHSEESAKEYIKNLKRQKRYLKDVY